MRVLITTTDYEAFLASHYARHPGLEARSFEEQATARASALFSVAGFYAANLIDLGHEATVFFVNNRFMQRAWALENGVVVPPSLLSASPVATGSSSSGLRRLATSAVRRLVPSSRSRTTHAIELEIFKAQIRSWEPDVVIDQSPASTGASFWAGFRDDVPLIIAQHASAIPKSVDFTVYDLVVSSLPNLVDHFRNTGVSAELLRLGFEPSVLSAIGSRTRDIDVSFVGSMHPVHVRRRRLLEALCEELPVAVWGNGFETLPKTSPIRDRWRGEAWGREMFEILARSRLTVNVHEEVAGGHANNMRLYEATGMGAMLVTDNATDLADLFTVGGEVVTFDEPEACVDVIRSHLKSPDRVDEVATAGQLRTLRSHSYRRRMEELVAMIGEYMPKAGRRS